MCVCHMDSKWIERLSCLCIAKFRICFSVCVMNSKDVVFGRFFSHFLHKSSLQYIWCGMELIMRLRGVNVAFLSVRIKSMVSITQFCWLSSVYWRVYSCMCEPVRISIKCRSTRECECECISVVLVSFLSQMDYFEWKSILSSVTNEASDYKPSWCFFFVLLTDSFALLFYYSFAIHSIL